MGGGGCGVTQNDNHQPSNEKSTSNGVGAVHSGPGDGREKGRSTEEDVGVSVTSVRPNVSASYGRHFECDASEVTRSGGKSEEQGPEQVFGSESQLGTRKESTTDHNAGNADLSEKIVTVSEIHGSFDVSRSEPTRRFAANDDSEIVRGPASAASRMEIDTRYLEKRPDRGSPFRKIRGPPTGSESWERHSPLRRPDEGPQASEQGSDDILAEESSYQLVVRAVSAGGSDSVDGAHAGTRTGETNPGLLGDRATPFAIDETTRDVPVPPSKGDLRTAKFVSVSGSEKVVRSLRRIQQIPYVATEDGPDIRIWNIPASSSFVRTTIYANGKAVMPPRKISSLPLDSVAMSTIDYHKIREVCGPFPEALQMMVDWMVHDDFADLFSMSDVEPGKVSRHFGEEDLRLLEQLSTDEVPCWEHPIFKVGKDEKVSRLIMDCRRFNIRFKETCGRPPQMNLPRIPEIIDKLLQYQFLGTVDAKSYFYQFEIISKLKRIFGFRVGAKRGRFWKRSFSRLPMGACFAPSLAQHMSDHLLAPVLHKFPNVYAVAWIDNFIFAGRSAEEVDKALHFFQGIAKEVRLELKMSSLVWASSTIEILGMVINAHDKIISPTPAFQRKWEDILTSLSKRMTLRSVYKFAGCMLWLKTILWRQPLCTSPNIIRLLQKIGTKIANGGTWDEEWEVDDDLLEEMRRFQCWPTTVHVCKTSDGQHVTGFSDASTIGLGGVEPTTGLHFAVAIICAGDMGDQIYRLELLAALEMIRELEDEHPGVPKRLIVDNQAVARTLTRGHSSDWFANMLLWSYLDDIANLRSVGWISSEENLADAYSRLDLTRSKTWVTMPSAVMTHSVCWKVMEEKRGAYVLRT